MPTTNSLLDNRWQSPDDDRYFELRDEYSRLHLRYNLAIRLLVEIRHNLATHGEIRVGRAIEKIDEFLGKERS